MTRRGVLASIVAAVASVGALGWLFGRNAGAESDKPSKRELPDGVEPLELSDAKWDELLDDAAYGVLRDEDTEYPGSSPLNSEKRPGTFLCAGCFLPLFRSETKYESGTGWPSFFDALPRALGKKTDYKAIVPRTEYHCARCEGHQGHVFADGPRPTGLRYCNNGVALRFVPDGESLPALRMAS